MTLKKKQHPREEFYVSALCVIVWQHACPATSVLRGCWSVGWFGPDSTIVLGCGRSFTSTLISTNLLCSTWYLL